MSDAFFDADRDAGKYPPKGWGWYSDTAKKQKLRRLIKKRIEHKVHIEEWILVEAARFNIKIKETSE